MPVYIHIPSFVHTKYEFCSANYFSLNTNTYACVRTYSCFVGRSLRFSTRKCHANGRPNCHGYRHGTPSTKSVLLFKKHRKWNKFFIISFSVCGMRQGKRHQIHVEWCPHHVCVCVCIHTLSLSVTHTQMSLRIFGTMRPLKITRNTLLFHFFSFFLNSLFVSHATTQKHPHYFVIFKKKINCFLFRMGLLKKYSHAAFCCWRLDAGIDCFVCEGLWLWGVANVFANVLLMCC